MSLDFFNNSSTTKDGKQRQCKSCKKAANDPEKAARRVEKFFQNNPKKRAEYSKKWREENENYQADYYKRNKSRIVEQAVEHKRKRRAEDLEYRTKDTLRSNISNYLRGRVKAGATQQILGYTFDDFWQEFELDILAFRLYGISYEVDHKIPISWFSQQAPISLIWDLRNLQIIEAGYNSKKRNYWAHPVDDQYYKLVMPFLLRDGH
jgi:hypothetical protein